MEDYFYNISLLVHDLLEQDEPVSNYVRELYEQEIEKIANEPDGEYVASPEFSNLLTSVLIYKIIGLSCRNLVTTAYVESLKLNMMS